MPQHPGGFECGGCRGRGGGGPLRFSTLTTIASCTYTQCGNKDIIVILSEVGTLKPYFLNF